MKFPTEWKKQLPKHQAGMNLEESIGPMSKTLGFKRPKKWWSSSAGWTISRGAPRRSLPQRPHIFSVRATWDLSAALDAWNLGDFDPHGAKFGGCHRRDKQHVFFSNIDSCFTVLFISLGQIHPPVVKHGHMAMEKTHYWVRWFSDWNLHFRRVPSGNLT